MSNKGPKDLIPAWGGLDFHWIASTHREELSALGTRDVAYNMRSEDLIWEVKGDCSRGEPGCAVQVPYEHRHEDEEQ